MKCFFASVEKQYMIARTITITKNKHSVYIVFILKTGQVKRGLTVSCGVSLWRDLGPDSGLPTHVGVSPGGPPVLYCKISLIIQQTRFSLFSEFHFRYNFKSEVSNIVTKGIFKITNLFTENNFMTEMRVRTAQLPEKEFKNTSPNKGLRLKISLSHTLHDGV